MTEPLDLEPIRRRLDRLSVRSADLVVLLAEIERLRAVAEAADGVMTVLHRDCRDEINFTDLHRALNAAGYEQGED